MDQIDDLEDALFDFYSEDLPAIASQRGLEMKELYVKTLVINGVEHQWRADRGLVKK